MSREGAKERERDLGRLFLPLPPRDRSVLEGGKGPICAGWGRRRTGEDATGDDDDCFPPMLLLVLFFLFPPVRSLFPFGKEVKEIRFSYLNLKQVG